MRRTVLCLIVLTLLGSATCLAQSNETIDRLLSREVADFGSTVYMVLSAGDLIQDSASVDSAYGEYQSFGWQLGSKSADDSLTVSELSYLIMKSLNVSGGFMYAIFPSPRYAFRELVYKNVLSRQIAPGSIVSGEEVLRYLGAVLRLKEEG